MKRILALAAILLAAWLSDPGEAAPPGRPKPDPAKVQAWEQAKAREAASKRALEGARWRADAVAQAGRSIEDALCDGRVIVAALQERSAEIERSAAHMASLGMVAGVALRAVDGHFAAGQKALHAGLRFSAAAARDAAALAREADAVADAALARRATAEDAVSQAEGKAVDLRNSLARAERAHHDAANDLARLQKSAAALTRLLREALNPPARARADQGVTLRAIGARPCPPGKERRPPPAAALGDLDAALYRTLGAGNQWAEAVRAAALDAGFIAGWKARPALLASSRWQNFEAPQAFQNARIAELVEVRADAFVAALAARCAGDPRCLKRQAGTIAEARRALAGASAATARRRQALEQGIAELEPARQALAELAQRSQRDDTALDRAMAALEWFQSAAEQAEALAERDVEKAQDALDSARVTASEAYLAAFGEPRPIVVGNIVGSEGRLLSGSEAALVGRAAPVRAHVYELVTQQRDAPEKTYGAYTYVLFPLRGAIPAESRSRYQALLTAIVSTTPHASRVRIDPKQLNVFCIPSRIQRPKDESRFDLADYDGALALAQLATAGAGAITRPDILDGLRFSPGPFLLTTYAPLEKVRSDSPMLFLDLSGFPPGTYRDLVAGYKAALVSEPPAGQDAWDPGTVRWAFSRASVLYADGKAVYSRVKDMLGAFFPSEAKAAGGQRVALVR